MLIRLSNALETLSKALVKVTETGLWIGFLALIVTVGLQVVARDLFRVSIIWTLDVSQVLFSWLIFIGAAIAFRKGAHYIVDLVPNAPQTVNTALRAISTLAAALVVYVLIVPGFGLVAIRTNGEIPSLGISTLWVYLPMPIAGLIMLVFVIEDIVGRAGDKGAS